MSVELILGGLFILILVGFLAGMLLLPEIFGISKKEDVEKKDKPENN